MVTHCSDTKASFFPLPFSLCSLEIWEKEITGVFLAFFPFGSELNMMFKCHNYPQPRMMILQCPNLRNVTLDILFLSQWLFYISDFQCHIPWMIFWCKKTIWVKHCFRHYKTIFILCMYTYNVYTICNGIQTVNDTNHYLLCTCMSQLLLGAVHTPSYLIAPQPCSLLSGRWGSLMSREPHLSSHNFRVRVRTLVGNWLQKTARRQSPEALVCSPGA